MYFRRIGTEKKPTYMMTNSSGQVSATVIKDGVEPNTWKVVTGPKKAEDIKATGLDLESALNLAEMLEV